MQLRDVTADQSERGGDGTADQSERGGDVTRARNSTDSRQGLLASYDVCDFLRAGTNENAPCRDEVEEPAISCVRGGLEGQGRGVNGGGGRGRRGGYDDFTEDGLSSSESEESERRRREEDEAVNALLRELGVTSPPTLPPTAGTSSRATGEEAKRGTGHIALPELRGLSLPLRRLCLLRAVMSEEG